MASLLSIFRRESRKTSETLAATRAVTNIAQALSNNRTPSPEDVQTADRVLNPPVSWEGIMRKPPARARETRRT